MLERPLSHYWTSPLIPPGALVSLIIDGNILILDIHIYIYTVISFLIQYFTNLFFSGCFSDVKRGKPGTKAPNIVLITLSAAVHLTKTLTLQGYFTHIVIDEAGQALETEAIIPLALAKEDTCVVLAGDPRQMSPKVKFRCGIYVFDMIWPLLIMPLNRRCRRHYVSGLSVRPDVRPDFSFTR